MSYARIGQYQEALSWCEKAVRQEPNDLLAHIMMTVVYSWSGREKEARAEAAEVLRIQPKFSREKFAQKLGNKDQEYIERFVGALRQAGLK